MPQCAVFQNLTVGLQKTTALVLQPAPADQTPATCTGYILLTPEEFSSLQEPFFLPLTIPQAVTIATAILALWSLAFVWRHLWGFLSPSSTED